MFLGSTTGITTTTTWTTTTTTPMTTTATTAIFLGCDSIEINLVFELCLDQTFLTQFFFRIQHFHLFLIKGLASPRTPPFQTCKKSGTWEPSSQTFLEEIWTFFRYQRFKEINLKFGCGFVKTWSNKSHFHYILT